MDRNLCISAVLSKYLVCILFFYRPDLIDESIESAVAQMQSVIELGRYIRDVKVMPTKVLSLSLPLPPSLSLSLFLAVHVYSRYVSTCIQVK